MSQQGDRTEKATPKRREDARRKGQIARSGDLPGALGFLAALLTLSFLGSDLVAGAGHLFAETMRHAADYENLTPLDVYQLIIEAGKSLALLTLPVIATALVAGVAGNFAQGGLSFSTEALKPKADKFNPAKNIKRIFSADSAVGLIKTAVKIFLLGAVSYNVLSPLIWDSAAYVNAPIETTMVRLGEIAMSLGWRLGFVLLMLAIADYGWSWHKHEKSLKMTKQEIKEEFKDQEGDPLMKGQRRRAARELVRRRSLSEVPKADVVITNPTHFAVALRYDRERDAAPVVVAKGADALAAQIRKIAKENDVALVENPPLARALFKVVEPGQLIPADLFRAVAEVLAYVYQKRNEARGL